MMKIPKRLIIDIESNRVMGIQFVSRNGEKCDFVFAGKGVISVSKQEQAHVIYKLLQEHCDVVFCTTQVLEDFKFYPIAIFSIFAVDSKGNCFGTIGGSGSLAQDDYPVGYVCRNGMFGKIANSLKEFLELVTFYPYWWDILKYEQMRMSYDINAMELEKIQNNLQCSERQREIQEILKLSYNPKSIELLTSCIKSPPEFKVYASREEAQKANTFFDTTPYWSELEKQKELLLKSKKKVDNQSVES